TVEDETGEITAVWFNQEWLADKLQPGACVRLRGRLRQGEFHVRKQDLNGGAAMADLAPIYAASEELSSQRLAGLVAAALPHARDLPELLPARVRTRERLPLVADAVTALHRPRSPDDAEAGRRRLAFAELLVLQRGLARRRPVRAGAV